MKKEIEKQIKKYSIELDNLKENRARECDNLSDAENHEYDSLIHLTARIIIGLKNILAKAQ